MKLYISGPMSNYPDFNFPAFNAAAEELAYRHRARGPLPPVRSGLTGWEVVNPATFEANLGKSWEDCLRYDLSELLKCDGVATLPGWQESAGAILEVHVAQALRIPVSPVDVWARELHAS